MQNECLEDQRADWFSQIDFPRPFWRDYHQLLRRLSESCRRGSALPDASELQSLLPEHAANQFGEAITFRPSQARPAVEYEMRIFQSGQVSTRENDWHDFFNALVWARFPHLKSAINALHIREINAKPGVQRGRLRDALTLLDECGVILATANDEVLERISARDWQAVFRDHAARWQHEIQIFVFGHALLEKFLKPYKSLTAHAILVRLDGSLLDETRESLSQTVDLRLAEALLGGRELQSPADLSPLPLMGIPGWWTMSPQNEGFYADRQVFRPPAERFRPAPVFDLR